MINIIREQLQRIIDDIDCGNTNMSEEEEMEVIKALKRLTRKDLPLSKVQAYTYLGISRATFDNLVKEGKLPKGKKQQGFKELFWYKRDLKRYIDGGVAKID